VSAGDDPAEDSMVRARRVVHALGGVQRANFSVRLWLALSGQIPWDYLPAIPGELFLLPEQTWLSPARFSPWARGVLTPYYILARAPGFIHLPDASPLLLRRHPDGTVTPRLTRPGLAGDLLQAFDRTVKMSRKLPRGALPRWAVGRAAKALEHSRQSHGGWFSFRPTLLSLVALRVMGASTDDPRLRAGLDYLRRSRGLARIPHGVRAGEMALAQGLSTSPLSATAGVLTATGDTRDVGWLLRQEISQPGPWQARADTPAGGWPSERRAGLTLDIEATCAALECLGVAAGDGHHRTAAWGATRRATDVLLAMQEGSGGFSRFERGESRVFMRRFPWTDADLLASGAPGDGAHVNLTARALTQLGRLGFRLDDDRVERGIRWLERSAADEHDHRAVTTLANLARCTAVVCPPSHPLRQAFERRLRARQREDGSFGSLVETSLALRALLELGAPCVQAVRAARQVVDAVSSASASDTLAHGDHRTPHGMGLSPICLDPSAAAREAYTSLRSAHEALSSTPRTTNGTRKR
jgi:squalene-hopene/tetraprenyl-beta-curcumene cyclase